MTFFTEPSVLDQTIPSSPSPVLPLGTRSSERANLKCHPHQRLFMNIVVVNSGSSSLKMSMFQSADDAIPMQSVWDSEQDIDWQKESSQNIQTKVDSLLSQLWHGDKRLVQNPEDVAVVGHRIVHGGSLYSNPIEITPAVLSELKKLDEFAPLHNPINLQALSVVQQLLPKARHIAVFDTAFHASLKPEVATYPVPYAWYTDLKIKKYGFHGINHQYCSWKAAQMLPEPRPLRLVSCHLGGGCSLAAIANGVSVDTTMGFTPLDGLMMRSRSGSVDPGILIYLLKNGKYNVDQLDRILNKESGMQGIFEKSADMRDIIKAMQAGDDRAKLTFDMFVHRLACEIGAMIAALGGIDALIFTGGIGEHSGLVRSATCKKFAFLNLSLNQDLNDSDQLPHDADVSDQASKVRVLKIAAREDWQIATECLSLQN